MSGQKFKQVSDDNVNSGVCILCFNREGQSFGATRNHIEKFTHIRDEYKKMQSTSGGVDVVDGDVTSKISRGLQRLTFRYLDYLNGNGSGIKSTVVDLVKSPVAVAPWQIPNRGLTFGNLNHIFDVDNSQNNTYGENCLNGWCSVGRLCRSNKWLCGEAVCLDCSSEELLLYVEKDSFERDAKWAVINIAGCPAEPPEVCECLRLCASCHSHAVHIQLQIIVKEQHKHEEGVINNVSELYFQLADLKVKISDVLKKYKELVSAVESERDLRDILPKGQSTTKVLAKYNSDTSDLFTQFAIDVQGFKRVRPKTAYQLRLISSIITAMHGYYSKQFFTFRDLQRILGNTLDRRALENVQMIVDCQTINCTFLALRQLGLECLELSHKHKLHSTIASLLAGCEEICKQELQKAVQLSGENWEQHEETIQDFLRVRLKGGKLIVPPKKKSAKFVEGLLLQKCDLILIKVERQLNAKARVNRFKQTKEALIMTRSKIKAFSAEG